MNPATSGQGIARLSAAALSIVLIVASFLLLAWSSVAAQLQWVTLRDLAAFSDAGHALRWNFATRQSVVLPGSIGLAAAQFDPESGLSWKQASNGTDVSLRLPRPALALHALHGARLSLRSDAPLRLRLWAMDEAGAAHPGAETVHSGGSHHALALALPHWPGATSAHGLRLHVESAPGTRIELRRLDLYPSTRTMPKVCEARDSVAATLAHCGSGLHVVHVHGADLPERLLRLRDELEAASLAFVYPAVTGALPDGVIEAQSTRFRRGVALLTAPLALALLFVRLRRSAANPNHVSAWALLVLLGPAALLWLGIPGEDDNAGLKAFAGFLCLPLLFTRVARPWTWLGDTAAWKATAGVTAAALGLLALFALLNSTDADGFGARLPDLDKLWIYPAWALVQQFLLIEFIAPRTRQLVGTERGGAILAGALFGLLHLPNFFLMLLTFLAAAVWSRLGYRHQALLPLVASHSVLGLLAMTVTPSWLLRSAEIGGRFLMTP
ncbi:MAG: hypothetical protein LKM32_10850 [Chiayiivirga sp.]|uniref:CPBP family glutamic-type intramembrane protease n=1 Tax=Chiayiivirga sp. TaxID=2041042 RepID=UPI0025C0C897|nr:CPBP family glutamic-type intramembrane protease [Chiayiivirga sp.]MCI1709841.1 hypothetical protein [Chiayiivirga sp.]MCI1729849.1 hypothetical protein [Chiayiivirga sp.]